MTLRRISFLMAASWLACAPLGLAQETPAKPPAEPPAAEAKPADPNKPQAAAFAKVFDEWKSLLKELRKLKVDYQSADAAQRPEMEEQWKALVDRGNEMVGQLTTAAQKAYEETPNADPQLTRLLTKISADALAHDEYDTALAISQDLIEHNSGEKQALDTASLAAYATHDFDKAAEYHKLAQDSGVASNMWQEWGADPAEYNKLWEAEQKIRAEEEKKNDLPRVKLTTTKGDIVIELFEDQAPDTVGNFVSLVEKGFYNDKIFHRVLPNFMAQGGCPKGDGTGGPGYTIPCECYREDYRRHFRGSLSMAHAGRDTGGSQFFLTFRPTPHLNGKHTCFGRVIEGMDVLAKLERRDPDNPGAEPDKIVTAEVVRKRDHAYVPKKVE
jgi:cyclophilin family peptidyl-prolyl cis-trans isomerase